MRMKTILAGGIAVVALAATAFAQASTTPKPAKATTAAHAKASMETAHGTLTAVDAAANSITLKSGKKEWTFSTGSSTVIHEGSKSITLAELASHKGHEAKVRYSESGGTKMAQSVTVAAAKASKPATN